MKLKKVLSICKTNGLYYLYDRIDRSGEITQFKRSWRFSRERQHLRAWKPSGSQERSRALQRA